MTEVIKQIPVEITAEPEFPPIGTRWEHSGGACYRVIQHANAHTTQPDRYPKTVVYQGENGHIWSRPLSDWARSFTQKPTNQVDPDNWKLGDSLQQKLKVNSYWTHYLTKKLAKVHKIEVDEARELTLIHYSYIDSPATVRQASYVEWILDMDPYESKIQKVVTEIPSEFHNSAI